MASYIARDHVLFTEGSKKILFSLTTFVATVVGVAVVFCAAGIAVGGIIVYCSIKGASKTPVGVSSSPTQFSHPSIPDEAHGQVMPEYEVISLQDLQLTSNTAYGIKP